MRIIKFEALDSTQNKAFELLERGESIENTFIVAGAQKKGRGRSHTAWTTLPGSLAFSYVTKSKTSALGVLERLKRAFLVHEVHTDLKWPNDIVLNGHKVGGVIVEKLREHSVIGVGVNLVGHYVYATVEHLTGRRISCEELLEAYASCGEVHLPDMAMSAVWFENEMYEVTTVEDTHLTLENSLGKVLTISASEYSYLDSLKRIVKKPSSSL